MNEDKVFDYTHKLSGFVVAISIVWIIVIINQAVIGLFTCLFGGYGFLTLGCAAWNIVQTVKNFKLASRLRKCNNLKYADRLLNSIENSITSCWIFMIINLFLGGFVGVFGNLSFLILAYCVKSKRKEFVPIFNPNF